MTPISKTGKQETDRTLQKMFIESYDREFNINASENLTYNPAGSTAAATLDREIEAPLAVIVATDSGDSSVDYAGFARTGELTSNAVWRILKIDATTGIIITWADGNSDFDNEWDNREALSYS